MLLLHGAKENDCFQMLNVRFHTLGSLSAREQAVYSVQCHKQTALGLLRASEKYLSALPLPFSNKWKKCFFIHTHLQRAM